MIDAKKFFAVLLSKRSLTGAVFTFGCAAAAAVVLVIVNTGDAAKTLAVFFTGPWSSMWFFGNTLDSITLLLTAALGAVLAFRGGLFNLGGEGQIYLGGLAATALLLSPPVLPDTALLICAALAAVLAGGCMGGISGLLKEKFNVNELITTFLLSAALSPLADYCITGPLRNSGDNLLASPRFAGTRRLPALLPPSILSVSFIFALILVLLVFVFIYKTGSGYRYRIAGSAPVFARFGVIRVDRIWTPALFASGALHGLTGFFAVAGTYGMCHLGFSGGLGWSAIAVALIGRNHPAALIPAALVYGWLKAGSDAAMLTTKLNVETSSLIQALVLLLATIQFKALPLFKAGGPAAAKRRNHP
jgi:simple sugar transport system permease protein